MSLLLLFGGSGGTSVSPTAVAATATATAPGVGPSTTAATATATAPRPRVNAVDGLGLNNRSIRTGDELLWVSNLLGTQVYAIANPDGLEVEQRFQSLEALRWRLRADDEAVDYIGVDYEVTYDGVVYSVTVAEPVRTGVEAWVEYEAEARWVRLNDDKHPGDFVLTGKTIDLGLARILADSGWTATTNGGVGTYGMTMTDQSTLALLREWAKVTGCEIAFDTAAKTVTFSTQIGTTNSAAVRYGRNLKGIRKRTEPPRATKLWAYGRASLPVNVVGYVSDYSYYTGLGLSSAEAIARFTKEEVWVDESFIDQPSLQAAANARLDVLAQPKITYECDVVDLSVMSGYVESFAIGDRVRVTDEALGIDVQTRVSRLVTRPLDPSRNIVELVSAFDPVDSASSPGSRGGLGDSWYHLQQNSSTSRTIGAGETLLAVQGVSFVEGQGIARFDVSYWGTCTGTGTLRVQLYDETHNASVREESIAFTNGQVLYIDYHFDLTALSGDYLYSIRSKVTSGAGTVSVVPTSATGGVHFAMLVQGGLGVAVPPADNSITFTYTGAVQQWTIPPNITSINIDAYGGAGGSGKGAGGGGARVLALNIPVTAGNVLDIYVGGQGGSNGGSQQTGAWPDGGDGGASASNYAPGGGGSSSVRPSGDVFTNSYVVAAGGGGAGDGGMGATNANGGAGGLEGADGASQTGVSNADGGGGATVSAGGSAGAGGSGYSDGAAGTVQYGGAGGGDAFQWGGGGGGGGWYGGGGGEANISGPGSAAGGGGSSHSTVTAMAVLYESGTSAADGIVTISWDPT